MPGDGLTSDVTSAVTARDDDRTCEGAPVLRGRRHSTDIWIGAIEDWLIWLRASGAPPSTLRLRRHQIRAFAEPNLGRSPWRLGADDLARYLASHERWAPETLKSARSCLRSFYAWASLTGRVRLDPAAVLPPVRVPDAPPRPVDVNLYDRALAGADDRTRLMLLLGYLAGLRVGEIARLRLADVDRAHAELIVRGKGGRGRRVPIHPRLQAELYAELARRRSGGRGDGWRYQAGSDRWLFPGRYGRGVTAAAVSRVISRALHGQATAHQLRHGFASAVHAGTGDLRVVQELLGHAQVSTTVRYTLVPADALADAVANLRPTRNGTRT